MSERSKVDLLDAIGEAYRALHVETAALDELLADRQGLNRTDARCLDLIDQHGGSLAAGRLAELTGLTTGAMTKAIDRLVARGFARRESDPADRRRVHVVLDESRRRESLAYYEPIATRSRARMARHTISGLESVLAFLSTMHDETASRRRQLDVDPAD